MRNCVLLLVAASAAVPLSAQGGFTAQWSALVPITAAWTNAPPGTPNAVVTFPAGPLPAVPTTVGVTVAGVPNAATFDWAPLPLLPGMASRWSFTAWYAMPMGQRSLTTADLLLVVDGPAAAVGSVEFRVTCNGDSPSPQAFTVDVRNDGTIDLTSFPNSCPSMQLDRRASYPWRFAQGPLQVRVQHVAYGWEAPQTYALEASFSPWVSCAEDLGPACPVEGAIGNPSEGYYTDYHLAALPPIVPTDLVAMRATGLGTFGAFLVSAWPDTAPFQLGNLPRVPCDLFTGIVLTVPGFASRTAPIFLSQVPVEWVAEVPQLPPGLDVYVMHASLHVPYLGFTNRVLLRT